MVLETSANVDKIVRVNNEANEQVPPASDDYRHIFGSTIDISSGYSTQTTAPDRADEIVIHVSDWGPNGGDVTLYTLDPDGQRLTPRTTSDNAAYGSESGEDVLVEASVASPFLEIEITGDGPVNASIYIR